MFFTAIAVIACAQDLQPGAVGSTVPDYAAANLEGDTVRMRGIGAPVLLNVWATWCPPCRRETPELQSLHERYGARGLRVIGVSIDAAGAADQVRGFMREYGVTYEMLHDPGDRVSAVFRVQGVPTTYLIDREGEIVWRHMGAVTAGDETLLRRIDRALD